MRPRSRRRSRRCCVNPGLWMPAQVRTLPRIRRIRRGRESTTYSTRQNSRFTDWRSSNRSHRITGPFSRNGEGFHVKGSPNECRLPRRPGVLNAEEVIGEKEVAICLLRSKPVEVAGLLALRKPAADYLAFEQRNV